MAFPGRLEQLRIVKVSISAHMSIELSGQVPRKEEQIVRIWLIPPVISILLATSKSSLKIVRINMRLKELTA